MIELFLVKPNQLVEIPTSSITWTGQRYNAARKIEAKILYNKKGGHQYTKVYEGDTVLFRWKKKEIFRGVIFNRSRNKDGTMTITAYDMLQYLILNKDTYIFSKKRLDEILIRMCKDFQIPYTSIVNTKYVMKSQVFKNETSLYDIFLKALVETEKQTDAKYQLLSTKGKLQLREWTNSSKQWVLETGVNIIDYDYSTSIEETATKVKLVAGEDKKTISAVVTDSDGKKKYGVLQYYERINEKLNQAQLNARAKKTLAKKKSVKRTISIDAIGIIDLVSGMPVYIIEKDVPIKGTYFIDSDTHNFSGNKHDMSLELIKKNSIAEVS